MDTGTASSRQGGRGGRKGCSDSNRVFTYRKRETDMGKETERKIRA